MPIVQRTDRLGTLAGQGTTRLASSFLLRGVDLWTPSQPALYVLHVVVREQNTVVDQSYETFGLRQIKVDSAGPRLLLNGARAAFLTSATMAALAGVAGLVALAHRRRVAEPEPELVEEAVAA